MADDTTAAAPATARAKPAPKPMRKAKKGEGWTPLRRDRFLDELARTCNVSHSAAQAGMCDSGAYKLRARSDAFRARWEAALAIGYEQIEMLLMQRALAPEKKELTADETKRQELADRLRLNLLGAHRGTVQAVRGRAEPAPKPVEPRRILEERLRTMRRNLGIDG